MTKCVRHTRERRRRTNSGALSQTSGIALLVGSTVMHRGLPIVLLCKSEFFPRGYVVNFLGFCAGVCYTMGLGAYSKIPLSLLHECYFMNARPTS